MINNFLCEKIAENFVFSPTSEQSDAILQMSRFLMSRQGMEAFLLRGYAGTGKTTLVGSLVKALAELEQPVVLMAPTGRAAKVFANYAGHTAYTIHKCIYRQRSITDDSSFSLNVNLHKHTLFIVDEASMISNQGFSSSSFGTGRLLDDLIQYVYSSEGCRLMIVGDTAQLPPVGEESSPALSPDILKSYGLVLFEKTLTQVMRQLTESGILHNATTIRHSISPDGTGFPSVTESAYNPTDAGKLGCPITLHPDVRRITGDELIESLITSYSRWGTDECMVICRSNKRANIYNRGIRASILYKEEELTKGDRLMIVKNNYHWTEQESRRVKAEEGTDGIPLSFIANGDLAVVQRIRRTREMYGFHFADALLSFPDYDGYEIEATVLLDTLRSESPALTQEESSRLFESIMEDYIHITPKRERYKQLREDPYFNALQIKYAYAVTCHKAQGGQWECIYIDQGYLPPDISHTDYSRWLYTAFTRATQQVYLVNWPQEMTRE